MFEDREFIITDSYEALDKRAAALIFSEMEEFANTGIDILSKAYWNNRQGAEKTIQESMDNGADEKGVINYYKTTFQYIYELGYWEAQRDKQREMKKLYLACRKFGLKHILDYGGGTGGLALYLNRRGIRCDYLDIPGKTFDFARFRFLKRDLKINMFNGLELDIAAGYKYEAVICHDVLEHVFDLEKTIKTINVFLRQGGFFIHRSTFGTGGIHLKKHAIYQDFSAFNRLLNSRGFKYEGRIKADIISTLAQKIGLRYALFGIRISRKMKYGGNFLLHTKVADAD